MGRAFCTRLPTTIPGQDIIRQQVPDFRYVAWLRCGVESKFYAAERDKRFSYQGDSAQFLGTVLSSDASFQEISGKGLLETSGKTYEALVEINSFVFAAC